MDGNSASLQQPQPRPERSARDAARIRAKNRRLEYLRRHPGYLASSDREFANVTLYNMLIRSFQTPAERAAEAQDKGFGQVLEASILRNPERLFGGANDDDIIEEEEEEDEVKGEEERENDSAGEDADGSHEATMDDDFDDDFGPRTGPGLLDRNTEETVQGLSARDAAQRRWRAFVRDWFVRGGACDDGFDYTAVDDDSEYDVLARADAEDAWFDQESPGWASDGEGDDDGDGNSRPRIRTGETGIQDF